MLRFLKRPTAYIIILLFLLTSTGCRLTYLIHAASGQWRLLRDSIPVEEALEENLGPREKAHLLMVGKIKEFGEEVLRLRRTENYQSIYLKSNNRPIYIVAAAPKARLTLVTWWFPVVGNLPYLGFFDLAKARKERERLQGVGYDVTLGAAEAYSTLGWFKDPVTMNLLKGSTLDLVETILHEMTHATLYVKGNGEFNEGLANFVGKVGAIRFFESRCGPSHPLTIEAKSVVQDERLFSSFLAGLLAALGRLYDSSLSHGEKVEQREEIFSAYMGSFQQLKLRFKTDRFVHFGSSGLNNAYILSVALYHRHFDLFERLYHQRGQSIGELLDYLKDFDLEKGSIWEKVKAG
ncbi:MAG: aminopeptidase [Deltaproteobacteria bacterium]|nr:aminopeptidase [Deltaproteobacteria bacterium]MBW2137250.1 aminopeptidase [Deltaproteobacteria bacterium]